MVEHSVSLFKDGRDYWIKEGGGMKKISLEVIYKLLRNNNWRKFVLDGNVERELEVYINANHLEKIL